jgi:hypothetical protein
LKVTSYPWPPVQIDLLTRHNHAAFGEEADAVGLGQAGGREAPLLVIFGDAGVRLAVEKCGPVAVQLDAGAIKPGLTAQRLYHLVDQYAPVLLRSQPGVSWRRGTREIGRLGAQRYGSSDERRRKRHWQQDRNQTSPASSAGAFGVCGMGRHQDVGRMRRDLQCVKAAEMWRLRFFRIVKPGRGDC